MRIKEEFKKHGYFWLPSAPERKIPGALCISDGGNIELEVIELFDLSLDKIHEDNNLERIVGIIEQDEYVTLDDCFHRQKNIPFGEISKKSLICANKAFIGVAYDEKETIDFNTFRFSVEGIDEWVGISGINVEHQYENEFSTALITYLPPEEILLDLNNGMQLLITFSWTVPEYPHNREAKITQKTYFKLVSAEARELGDFISIAHRIGTLLCFAIDDIVCLEHITATSDNLSQDIGDGNLRVIPITIYYPSIIFSKDNSRINLYQMLFRYAQIKNNAARIINNWIDAYDNIDPALNLYFSTKLGVYKYPDGKFLALIQGLETYHRRTSDEKKMEDDKFKVLVDDILCNCPTEHQEWLKGRLTHGNEINLRKRIDRIIQPFKELIGTKDECNKIINKIVDTRNYLTHYDESLKSKAASGRDLFFLCEKIEVFFQLHFLQVLDFNQEEIKSIVDNSFLLKEKLNHI